LRNCPGPSHVVTLQSKGTQTEMRTKLKKYILLSCFLTVSTAGP